MDAKKQLIDAWLECYPHARQFLEDAMSDRTLRKGLKPLPYVQVGMKLTPWICQDVFEVVATSRTIPATIPRVTLVCDATRVTLSLTEDFVREHSTLAEDFDPLAEVDKAFAEVERAEQNAARVRDLADRLEE